LAHLGGGALAAEPWLAFNPTPAIQLTSGPHYYFFFPFFFPFFLATAKSNM
jgi:hypothetical protein